MHTLYDSESFAVIHTLAVTEPAADARPAMGAAEVTLLPRHGFEIVDKRSGKEVYLDGAWSELFQQRLAEWQRHSPTQEEVEETLSQYAELATLPLYVH